MDAAEAPVPPKPYKMKIPPATVAPLAPLAASGKGTMSSVPSSPSSSSAPAVGPRKAPNATMAKAPPAGTVSAPTTSVAGPAVGSPPSASATKSVSPPAVASTKAIVQAPTTDLEENYTSEEEEELPSKADEDLSDNEEADGFIRMVAEMVRISVKKLPEFSTLSIREPQVLRTPAYWLLVMRQRRFEEEMVRSGEDLKRHLRGLYQGTGRDDLEGCATIAFRRELTGLFPMCQPWGQSHINNCCRCYCNMGLLVAEVSCREAIRRPTLAFLEDAMHTAVASLEVLNIGFIRNQSGAEAVMRWKNAKKFDANQFSPTDEFAVASVRRSLDTKRQRTPSTQAADDEPPGGNPTKKKQSRWRGGRRW